MNQVLKIAIELSEGNQILMNRNEKVTPDFLELTKGESRLFNSLYFSKNGVEYRISNHELPNRLFMEKHNFRNIDHAIEMGESKNLFHKNNIELIVENGQIVKNNLNFNF